MSDRAGSEPAAETGGQPSTGAAPEAGPVAIARLLDEIRRDRRWREEIEAQRSRADTPASAEPIVAAPPPDAALRIGVAALAHAIEHARAEVPVLPGPPALVGAWARLRAIVLSTVGVYQRRQVFVNGETAAALRRVAELLDPTDPGSAVGALWVEIARLGQRVDAIEARLGGDGASALRPGDDEGAGGASRLDGIERNASALALEIEPLGRVRAAVAEIQARLEALERDRQA
jgi:hypothetical protein